MTNKLIFKPVYNNCVSFEYYYSNNLINKIIFTLSSDKNERGEYKEFFEAVKRNERYSILGIRNLNISYANDIVTFQIWNYESTFVFTELNFKLQDCIDSFKEWIEYLNE